MDGSILAQYQARLTECSASNQQRVLQYLTLPDRPALRRHHAAHGGHDPARPPASPARRTPTDSDGRSHADDPTRHSGEPNKGT
jgi:hypothetical protein